MQRFAGSCIYGSACRAMVDEFRTAMVEVKAIYGNRSS
jgi:hypothetical protein